MARTSAILVDVFMFRFPSFFPSTGRLASLVVKLPDETNGWPDAGLLLPDIERLRPHRAVGVGNQSVAARTKVTLHKRVSGDETVGLLLNCSGPATDHWRVDDPSVRSLLIEGIGLTDAETSRAIGGAMARSHGDWWTQRTCPGLGMPSGKRAGRRLRP
jgi:hypothetical protein